MLGERRRNFLFKHLHLHVGDSLGDMFACTGIVHHVAEMTETLIVDTSTPLKETMVSLFSEFPNILPLTKTEYEQYKLGKEKIQEIKCPGLSVMPTIFDDDSRGSIVVGWERQHYENFDLPFSKRYTDFKLPKNIPGSIELCEKLTEGEKDFIVVNRYMGGEFNYMNYLVEPWNPLGYKVVEITPYITKNVLEFTELFRRAKQIHVVPTSIHQLVDGMTHEIPGELFFHNIRRNFFSPVNCKWNEYRWKIIDYKQKL